MRFRVLLPLIVLLVLPHLAFGQAIVVNPSALTFAASPNHSDVIIGTSTPLVTSYSITVRNGAAVVFGPTTVGKPTPDGTNTITVPPAIFAAVKAAVPTNVSLTGTVTTIYPGGSLEGPSDGPFAFAVPGAAGALVAKP